MKMACSGALWSTVLTLKCLQEKASELFFLHIPGRPATIRRLKARWGVLWSAVGIIRPPTVPLSANKQQLADAANIH